MTRKVRLADIAVIRSGFVPSAAEARERKKTRDEEQLGPTPTGSRTSTPERDLGLQPSAIQADGAIAWEELVAVPPIRGSDRYEIREGELLLPLRSQRTRAVVARDIPGRVLAVGQWAMIAPDPRHADAMYLAWYLNHPRSQARLAGAMVGTSLQFLTLATVRDFEVELPDLATQRRIGRAAELAGRIAELEKRLVAKRQQLTDAVALAAISRVGKPSGSGS